MRFQRISLSESYSYWYVVAPLSVLQNLSKTPCILLFVYRVRRIGDSVKLTHGQIHFLISNLFLATDWKIIRVYNLGIWGTDDGGLIIGFGRIMNTNILQQTMVLYSSADACNNNGGHIVPWSADGGRCASAAEQWKWVECGAITFSFSRRMVRDPIVTINHASRRFLAR